MGASLDILTLHLLKNYVLSEAAEIVQLCVEHRIRALNSLRTPILHVTYI